MGERNVPRLILHSREYMARFLVRKINVRGRRRGKLCRNVGARVRPARGGGGVPVPFPFPSTPALFLPPSRPLPRSTPNPTLTPRTIMHHLMRKKITINTKHPPANPTLVPPTRSLRLILPPLLWRNQRKRLSTPKTMRAPPRIAPVYFLPVHEGEEVVV